jgi:transketolase
MGYMKCPIKLIGLVSGYAAGILGPTHTSIEDIAIMRSIPNMVVLSPADATETMKTIMAASELNCPTYIRFSGAERNPIVFNEDYEFSIGKAIQIREGFDISLIATGMMVSTAIKVAERIQAEHGYSCEIIDMHTIKPLDEDAIKKTLDKKLIVTLEEHSTIGGLGSAVSECLTRYLIKPPQLVIGINDRYQTPAKYSTLVSRAGLDSVGVYQSIMSFINDNELFL